MNKTYSHNRKERLVNKIMKIKRKRDLVKIFSIIQQSQSSSSNSDNVTENNNGIFMYFHNLSVETYLKLEECINEINKKNKKLSNNQNACSEDNNSIHSEESRSDKLVDNTVNNDPLATKYTPYASSEFAYQNDFNPRLKYSNKEKNLIKRHRYDKNIDKENNVNKSVVYCDFDVTNLTDSDMNMDRCGENSIATDTV